MADHCLHIFFSKVFFQPYFMLYGEVFADEIAPLCGIDPKGPQCVTGMSIIIPFKYEPMVYISFFFFFRSMDNTNNNVNVFIDSQYSFN